MPFGLQSVSTRMQLFCPSPLVLAMCALLACDVFLCPSCLSLLPAVARLCPHCNPLFPVCTVPACIVTRSSCSMQAPCKHASRSQAK